MLSSEIKMHHDYQFKLEEMKKDHEDMIVNEGKYQERIKKLIDSVGETNVELKGVRTLQEQSSVALKELNFKYSELRTDYIDLVTMTGMSRSKA